MFYYFEPNFIAKLLRESGFSNFGHVTMKFAKRKFVFGRHFGTFEISTIFFFAALWLSKVYTGMVQVFSYGKVLKNGWVNVGSPPLVHKREWKVVA